MACALSKAELGRMSYFTHDIAKCFWSKQYLLLCFMLSMEIDLNKHRSAEAGLGLFVQFPPATNGTLKIYMLKWIRLKHQWLQVICSKAKASIIICSHYVPCSLTDKLLALRLKSKLSNTTVIRDGGFYQSTAESWEKWNKYSDNHFSKSTNKEKLYFTAQLLVAKYS